RRPARAPPRPAPDTTACPARLPTCRTSRRARRRRSPGCRAARSVPLRAAYGSVLVVVVTGLLGEEAFELGAEFLTAGQLLIGGQQAGLALLRGDEAVVLALQGVHDCLDLGIA